MGFQKGNKLGGRKKGSVNKVTALLKDEILRAADMAHPGGRVGYLAQQAQENPGPFLALLGKVLPTQVDGNVGLTITLESDANKL